MKPLLLGIALAWAASADIASYTVSGHGDFSPPLSPLSDSPFWWIDNTGGISGSAFGAYGYNPAAAFAPNQWSGSTLLSSPFTLNNGDALNVTATLFEQNAGEVYSMGFALLLKGPVLQAILFNLRPDGAMKLSDLAAPPSYYFAPPSPGVTTTVTDAGDPLHHGNMPVTLGGNKYGPWPAFDPPHCGAFGYAGGGCSHQVSASYTPGAGTYELLFGDFSLPYGGVFAPTGATALAVNSVSVPEPSPSILVMLAALALVTIRRRPLRRRQS
jgi:hypothetical protein